MRSKKAPAKKTAKSLKRDRKVGLTSAIGPKATTALVLITIAGGLWYGSHQRLAAKAKASTSVETEAQPEMGADPAAPAPLKAPVAKVHGTTTPPPDTSASTKLAKAPVTTLEGCLERTGDAFRLKDTSGVDAPKARSWKSGFLKKGAASVDVLDPAESLGLANRVGTRVSVSGTLVDRQIQARAIHRVASSCSAGQP